MSLSVDPTLLKPKRITGLNKKAVLNPEYIVKRGKEIQEEVLADAKDVFNKPAGMVADKASLLKPSKITYGNNFNITNRNVLNPEYIVKEGNKIQQNLFGRTSEMVKNNKSHGKKGAIIALVAAAIIATVAFVANKFRTVNAENGTKAQ